MLRIRAIIEVLATVLATHLVACIAPDRPATRQGATEMVAGPETSSFTRPPSVAEAQAGREDSTAVGAAQAGHLAMDAAIGGSGKGVDNQSPLPDPTTTPTVSMPGGAPDAGLAETDPGSRNLVEDLSNQVLAMWGSSVCDGYSVPSGAGWPWKVEKRFAEIKGPKIIHVSTPGHTTDSKETALERSKIASAQFVVVCLSLGNQGLGSTTTERSAQSVVDSYLDDIMTDESDGDGDPVSLVHYIQSLGAYPIVALVYPMAGYTTLHCQHVVEANIVQQASGIPTVNHLGPTNAGNDFGENDCTWADGRNAPLNVDSDARHPNQLGHAENFYAFPPDLPFALASKIAFPVRPPSTDYFALQPSAGTQPDPRIRAAPIHYEPAHTIHSYTMQFGFSASSSGTLAAIDLGTMGFITLELNEGAIRLVTVEGVEGLRGSVQIAANEWHDVALTYSHVRQMLALYLDGALIGEHDTRQGGTVRELFPRGFVLGGPAGSGRSAAPTRLQLRDLFINRTSLHAMEVKERAKTSWVGAGSLDVYAPLRAAAPAENRAQTLQTVHVEL